ncbi:CDK5 regulatory subunit-associated protein 2, partial [Camelus ferus]
SGLVPNRPKDLDGVSPTAGLGNGVLPNVSEETVSPSRARNMKDFENQITELKKENFNLKLRIYFLEERMQQELDGPTEHVYKTASEGLSLTSACYKYHAASPRRKRVPHCRPLEVLCLTPFLFFPNLVWKNIELKVEVESLKRELQEREQLLIKASKAVESLAEGGGSEIQRVKKDAQKKDVRAAQAELEKAFAGTETEKALRLSLENKLAEMKKVHEGDLEMALVLEEKDRLIEELKLSLKSKEALIQCLKEEKSQMASPDENVSSGEPRGLSATLRGDGEREAEAARMERQKERNRFEERIQIEELNSEIKELSAAAAKAREAPQKAQTQKVQGSEDYEAALLEKAALLAELHSENLTKSTENHRLRRNMKKVTQELSDLQRERERLEKDLDAAHRERSKGDRAVHVSGAAAGPRKFTEKGLEVIPQNHYLTTAEDLELGSEGLITEKCPPQSPGSKTIFSEEKQQLGYEELIQVLKKERDIYTHLVKSLQDSDSVNSLQAELNNILVLRKRLQRDVLACRHLRKALEEQLSEIRRREALMAQNEAPSAEPGCADRHMGVGELIQLVKELHADNQHLKKTIFDLSCAGFPRDGRSESVGQMELLASKEDEDSSRLGEDVEDHFLSDQHPEQSNKSIFLPDIHDLTTYFDLQITEDYSRGGCKNGYLRHPDSNILDYDGAPKSGCPGDQSLEGELVSLLGPLFSEKATWLLESRNRPDLLKALRDLLLEQLCLIEQEASGEYLDGKTEKTLKQMALQLGGELGPFIHASSSSQPHEALKWPLGAQLAKVDVEAKVEQKDASVQTAATEGDMLRFRHEGQREAWEEKPSDAVCSAEHQPENLCRKPGRQATALSFPWGTEKNAKKSRLPILIKPSQSLGSVCRLPASQGVVAQLQGQILELQGELKESKIRNKQLHQKLILAEAMMEGRPAPDEEPLKAQPLVGAAYQDGPREQEGMEATPCVWRDLEKDSDQHASCDTDSEIYQPDDLAILPMCEENLSEDFPGPTSVATCLSSKSQFSTNVSVIGTDPLENMDASNDKENLRRKICDLETELEGYRNFILQLQKHSQFSEAVITVLCGTEGAQDGLNKDRGTSDEEERTFSSLHQVRYVKHMKILHPLAPEVMDGKTLESLRQRLVDQECELQREQNLNMELFSEIHNLQNKFRDLSPSRYDSLVQAQARELSLQRQQIKDSHGICVVYRQHMNTMIRAFEELLQASDVDHCVAEGFQEQLNQCAELLEQLEKLFLKGKSVEAEMNTQKELRERIEEDSLSYQHILPKSPAPSASRAPSDCDMSEKSSFSRDQKQDGETEKMSVLANNFSQDLLMEHIQEIRSLRKRLEESIKTNEKLRRQLERQGSEQGSSNIFIYGSELHNSLTSEIRFLRKQNQALNTMLAKGSRDKQKENEKLREALSRKTADLEHLQHDYACLRAENQRLQREVDEKESQSQQPLQEVCHGRSQLSRVQEEVKLRQKLLSHNDKLLRSLQVELKVYEKLDEEHRSPREIQALRAPPERSSETSSARQSGLQEGLATGREEAPGSALASALQTLPVPEQPLQRDKPASETPPLSGNDVDTLSCVSASSTTSTSSVSRLVPGHCLWASKTGCHILGLIEDYDALCRQIGQGQKLLSEMDIQIQEAPSPTSQELGAEGPHSTPLSSFVTGVSAARLTLDEAARLLTLLWRVSLPTDGQCTPHCQQAGEMKAEITKLHKKLFEQEKKLQNTMKLLQLSKNQEKVIFDQWSQGSFVSFTFGVKPPPLPMRLLKLIPRALEGKRGQMWGALNYVAADSVGT